MDQDITSQWKRLLNPGRRKPQAGTDPNAVPLQISDHRTEAEKDHDRIVFSTPVRRLADKTQVFPLDPNDSVRTRLTHSMEVSNLCRSIGVALTARHGIAKELPEASRDIPSILAAVGLAHDLGNPPFGHQGESAIGSWFRKNEVRVLGRNWGSNSDLIGDFLNFEGNAQTLRLVTRLQLLDSQYGLDLTYGTLAALMKYTVPVGDRKKPTETAANKKHGFHFSEGEIAKKILEEVGLAPGLRHPLAYVMEACDDIAYSVLDVEDAVKKGLLSFADVCEYLDREGKGDSVIEGVVKGAREKHCDYRDRNLGLTPRELGDISTQRLRVFAIGRMVSSVTAAFVKNEQSLVSGKEENDLLKLSEAEPLRAALKKLAQTYAYGTRAVLEVELSGYNILHQLMDMLWFGITDWVDEKGKGPASPRLSPFSRYVYGRISENYRRVLETPNADTPLPEGYREAQLLTDMIAGMTDSFALSLHAELKAFTGVDYDLKR